MKKSKNYRLSPRTVQYLEELKKLYPDWTETDIIEAAIQVFYWTEKKMEERKDGR